MLLRLYRWMLVAGDIIGKLLAFLTLPASVIAAYVYFDEVRDFFSKPDLDTEIRRVTLRCNYVWRDTGDYSAYQAEQVSKLSELCDLSPIAVSFEFTVTNNDAIARELRGLSVNAEIPLYGTLTLDEVQSIEHLIEHGVETNLRRDWRVETISAGSTAIFEILAFSSAAEGDDEWRKLADAMDEKAPSLLGKTATIDFEARVSGFFDAKHLLRSCNLELDQAEFDQWHGKSEHRRVQITNTCL